MAHQRVYFADLLYILQKSTTLHLHKLEAFASGSVALNHVCVGINERC